MRLPLANGVTTREMPVATVAIPPRVAAAKQALLTAMAATGNPALSTVVLGYTEPEIPRVTTTLTAAFTLLVTIPMCIPAVESFPLLEQSTQERVFQPHHAQFPIPCQIGIKSNKLNQSGEFIRAERELACLM
jgi:hypothetical protein